MIDFPNTDLLDDAECLARLERYLHPQGLVCPKCGSSDRRLFRRQSVPAYGCRACHAYYIILRDTMFAKTRQRPSTLVLLLRGVVKGKSTARLSRELDIDRKRLGEIRQQLQQNLVHCNSCEGAGAALRSFLRVFRGLHTYFLAEYVATFETMMNAKRITSAVVQRMCFGEHLRARTS